MSTGFESTDCLYIDVHDKEALQKLYRHITGRNPDDVSIRFDGGADPGVRFTDDGELIFGGSELKAKAEATRAEGRPILVDAHNPGINVAPKFDVTPAESFPVPDPSQGLQVISAFRPDRSAPPSQPNLICPCGG